MKTAMLALLLMTSPLAAWEDKALHFGVGYIGEDVIETVTGSKLAAVGFMSMLGVMKEASDDRFDWADLAFTVAGAGLACGVNHWRVLPCDKGAALAYNTRF